MARVKRPRPVSQAALEQMAGTGRMARAAAAVVDALDSVEGLTPSERRLVLMGLMMSSHVADIMRAGATGVAKGLKK